MFPTLPLNTRVALLVFGAATELEVLHETEYVTCERTFKMSPSTV